MLALMAGAATTTLLLLLVLALAHGPHGIEAAASGKGGKGFQKVRVDRIELTRLESDPIPLIDRSIDRLIVRLAESRIRLSTTRGG